MEMSTVPCLYTGSTIVCLGSGPSLTPEDVADCRRFNTYIIAVNDAYHLAPWAPVIYSSDATWWRRHADLASSSAVKYTIDDEARDLLWVKRLARSGQSGLELDPRGLRSGGHSGYAAINLAAHLGAATIVLLGYDMQPGRQGHHFFGDHPDGSHVPYETWIDVYTTLLSPLAEQRITIWNASRETAITAIPRRPLHAALCASCP